MKTILAMLALLNLASCSAGSTPHFTGSTPAGPVARFFLGIAATDSIDFIRWKLQLNKDSYELACHYGIGKPNTNGFINGGKRAALSGRLQKDGNTYILNAGQNRLRLAIINNDLLHILGDNGRLLAGNGGWSYTLNHTTPSASSNIYASKKFLAINDSLVLEGRTPCGIPGIIKDEADCYKLKWLITLYENGEKTGAGSYRISGTAWRQNGARKGNWKLVGRDDGNHVYRLSDENDQPLIYLLPLDENVVFITDQKGKLLTGNEDFSYTLNRRSKQ